MGQHNNKKKTNGLVGAKIGGGAGQPKEKGEAKWINRAKNTGRGRPTKGKERKQMD